MTGEDLEIIASAMREIVDEGGAKNHIVRKVFIKMCDRLEKVNPYFDRETFRDACGIDNLTTR